VKPLVLFLALLIVSCENETNFPEVNEFTLEDEGFSGSVSFHPLQGTKGFKILLIDSTGKILDHKVFPYRPYQFDTTDVNHDGGTDIIIGLTKSTRFDPVERKRLFVLRIDDGHLRPLWLGSKVCQDLIDFKALPNGHIQTLEQTANGFVIGDYYWQGFGLTLEQYRHHEISLAYAMQIFEK